METKERILEAARSEFLEKGFADASMRDIASRVGITATALYRHYNSKEEIFEAVVSPAVEMWEEFCAGERVRQTETAWKSGLDAMWNDESQLGRIVDIIYGNYEEQKLLFCQSEGTKYSGYLHQLVTRVQEYTLAFMEELEKKGTLVNHVDEREMHLLLSAQYSAILEMLEHGFTYDEAKHYAKTVTDFFRPGWRSYLGF